MSAVVLAIGVLVLIVVVVLRARGEQTISMPRGAGMTAEPDTIESLVAAGRKIDAIKLVRQETGLGLKEAKDQIDELSRRLPRR